MPLTNLQLERFRCITEARLDFDNRYNLIVGANASGKTSLLEAVYFLGRGRSFRTRRLERIIQQGAGDFLAVGKVVAMGCECRLQRVGRGIRPERGQPPLGFVEGEAGVGRHERFRRGERAQR